MGSKRKEKSNQGRNMQLFVKDIFGRSAVYAVDGTDSVEDLKMSIQARQGIPAKMQRLVGGGKDYRTGTLSDCGIENEATLELMLTLEGGVIEPTLQALARK